MGYIEHGGHTIKFRNNTPHGKLNSITGPHGSITFFDADDPARLTMHMGITAAAGYAYDFSGSIYITYKGSQVTIASENIVTSTISGWTSAGATIDHTLTPSQISEIKSHGGADFHTDMYINDKGHGFVSGMTINMGVVEMDGTVNNAPPASFRAHPGQFKNVSTLNIT